MKNKKEKDIVEEKNIVEEETKKSFFFPRLIAYLIDIILISFVSALLLSVVPVNKNHERYVEEYNQVKEDYNDKKITNKEFVNKAKDIVYDVDYTNTMASLTQVVILIGYFAIFQFYNNGQTLGKKIMKIKVVSNNDKDLTLNQLTLRSLIVNSIILNILLVMAVLFIGREYYYYTSLVIQTLDTVLIVGIIIMILFRKDQRGLHDVLTGTKVISSK